ncbi:MAG: cellulase family glycosylhydrolase [Bacteroidetes bacterium]|nr:cellulase family glycosylhydrolase [Bacteroidota bacterium]
MKHGLLNLLIFLVIAISNCSCSSSHPAPTPANQTEYNISNTHINKLTTPIQLIGVNALHVFSGGGHDLNSWNLDITREFVGNVKETPLTGYPIKDANGAYLYSLQNLADSNRVNHRITILCAFGWDGTSSTLFTGQRPTQVTWWNDFKTKLGQWAFQFKDQPDVWLEVWNEPYRYDRADGYTDDTWNSDMTELLNIVRSTGNNNIVLIPCAEQGQDESVLNNKGVSFLSGKSNVLFDIHAYEKWLLSTPVNVGNRLKQLKQNNLPVLFGETAPMNAGTLMNPQFFLDSVYQRGLSVCAWVWKYDGTDTDALLNQNGLPNNLNNNNWGDIYKELASRTRRP